MYALSDKPAAIREVQKFLHVISDSVNTSIPRVAIDGIYGEETENAVKIFQQLYGLEINGFVDIITFDMLYSLYSEALIDKNIRDYVITYEGFPIKTGNISDDVLVIHLMFSELEKTYKDIGRSEKSTYFSDKSRNTAMELQKIFRFPITGEVDARFFERMKIEIAAIKRLNEVYE